MSIYIYIYIYIQHLIYVYEAVRHNRMHANIHVSKRINVSMHIYIYIEISTCVSLVRYSSTLSDYWCIACILTFKLQPRLLETLHRNKFAMLTCN